MDFIKLTNKCINIYMFHYQNLMTGLEYAKENVPEFLTMLCVQKHINKLIMCLFAFSLCFEMEQSKNTNY